MMLNQVKRAVKVEERLFQGLRLHKTLFANLKDLGFKQVDGTRDGNEEHIFFNHNSGVITVDVMLLNRVIESVTIM